MNIGELAEKVGVSAKTIRFYETKGLLRNPQRNLAGYRQYEMTDLEQLRFIVQARALDLPIKEIQRLLALWREGIAPCEDIQNLIRTRVSQIEERIQELRCLQETLRNLQGKFEEQSLQQANLGCVCQVLGKASTTLELEESLHEK